MRGATTTPQPVKLQNHGVFLWNGEVYQFQTSKKESIAQDFDCDIETSDTEILATLLDKALMQQHNNELSTFQIITATMSHVVNGEFAFCIVSENDVFYGRDQWGRRSLLVSEGEDDAWRLSSVATLLESQQTWTEVPAGRVYQYNIKTGVTQSLPLMTTVAPPFIAQKEIPSTTPFKIPTNVSQSMWLASLQLEQLLTKAVRRRCCSVHKEGVGIMFSGGLDSVVLTALAAQILPPSLPMDLLNVSFADESADRQAAKQSYQELKLVYPEHTFRLVCVQADWDQVVSQHGRIEALMHPKSTTMDLNISTACGSQIAA